MYIGGSVDGRRAVVQMNGGLDVQIRLVMSGSRMCCLKNGRKSYGTCMSESYEVKVSVKFVVLVDVWV